MSRLWIGFFAFALNAYSQTPPPVSTTNCYPPIPKRNGRSLKAGADFSVDYLYWTAREDALEYAYTGSGAINNPAQEGKVFAPKFDWQSGYRVGLAAYTGYDGWDLFGQYTWFQSNAQSMLDGGFNPKPTWKIGGNTSNLSHASSFWDLKFNAFDLLLRRSFKLSSKFIVQPGLGLKYAWGEQRYNVTYDFMTGSPLSVNMKVKQKTQALGLEAAVSSNWYFTKPVSIFGKLAFSTMWFQYICHRIDMQETNLVETPILNTKADYSLAAPVFETFLGFCYESTLHKKRIQAKFIAGYEFQIWFDSNQFIRTILDSNGSLGNLNLQGLTLRGQLEF